MTKIEYKIGKDECILRVEGHAGYAEKGKDIVCAGISALCNALYRATFAANAIIQSETADGFFLLRATEHGGDVRAMYSMAVLGFNDISAEFPDFVKVERIF